MRFDGKVVLVTGAAGGFGSRTAERFAELGASLVLSDLDALALDAVAISPQVIADTLGAILKYQDDIATLHGSEASRILEDAKKRLEPA